MHSSSNYTVTAQDGGLVCSATWTTNLVFDVGPDSRVTGSATSDIVGAPVCTHPEVQSTQTTSIVSTIEGTASSSQLQLRLKYGSYDPVGSVEATGMSSSIYGFDYDSSPTITIPITSVGHAEGSQQLQSISGVNAYTSQNTITLDCQGC